MKLDIIVPSSGESVTEGDIARWFKETGDSVEMDEPLLELETDKASLEIAAEGDGILTILRKEGETVQVGSVIGYITEPDKKDQPTKRSGAAPKLAASENGDDESEGQDFKEDKAQQSTARNVEMPSPAARKLMAENSISSREIKGTGKDGRITKADVLAFLEERKKRNAVMTSRKKFIDFYGSEAPVVSPDETITLMRKDQKSDFKHEPLPSEISRTTDDIVTDGVVKTSDHEIAPATEEAEETKHVRNVRRERMTRIRKTISQRLVEAQQTAALLTTFNEIDMSRIVDIRNEYKEQFKQTHNVGLGFMSFFTKAACHALRHVPIVNAQIDGEDIIYFDYCDIGIAVATPKGLVVPVVRNAEGLSFHEIEQAIADLAAKGRDGKLSVDDLSGGTFTITNGGVFGSMLSTPIVNRPQSAVLGMHNIVERAVVRDHQVVVRPVMYAALTYDHRLIDGVDAVRFLVKIKELCEDPVKLLINI